MMAVLLLIAGGALVLAGLLAIAFGIPVKEFSFGNTLILTGAVAACSGMILFGLWTVVRELKNIAQRLGPGLPATSSHRGAVPAAAASAALRDAQPDDGFLFGRDHPAPENAETAEPGAPSPAMSPAPWQEESAARNRGQVDVPGPAVEAPPAVKQRRNLLFSSSSRKERERAQARTIDPSVIDARPAPAAPAPVPEPSEPPPATFDDAWPQSERSRAAAPPLRSSRAPSTFTETGPAADRHPPAARTEDAPAVTVLKSGVVDGMAYSLYSDGSIEAQMPEGMMRFASIDELRAHLDQRP
jgi:hypothetical protein